VTLGVHVTRQLWIQLRLLAMLTLPIVAAIVAVVVADQVGPAAGRLTLALAFAVAVVGCAALAVTGFTEEIRSGAAAWLFVRAVPRTSLLGAWLVVPSLAVLVAYVLAGVLAGLVIPPAGAAPPDPVTALVGFTAAAAPVIPLTALGLIVGVAAPGRVSALAVIGIAALAVVPALVLGDSAVHPASGYWLLAGGDVDRPLTVGLQAIGLCLALAALAWLVAARRFAARDL
jgi:hypothetical protein